MATAAAPASIAYMPIATLREGAEAPAVCNFGVEVAPVAVAELLEVLAASVATTTVTAVTVLKLPLGRVVVCWYVDVVKEVDEVVELVVEVEDDDKDDEVEEVEVEEVEEVEVEVEEVEVEVEEVEVDVSEVEVGSVLVVDVEDDEELVVVVNELLLDDVGSVDVVKEDKDDDDDDDDDDDEEVISIEVLDDEDVGRLSVDEIGREVVVRGTDEVGIDSSVVVGMVVEVAVIDVKLEFPACRLNRSGASSDASTLAASRARTKISFILTLKRELAREGAESASVGMPAGIQEEERKNRLGVPLI
jgi:hypothetical protein